jgi:3-deoxy-manno-octulosonate cytidylyltransferase (CMP-KDO synthetase)
VHYAEQETKNMNVPPYSIVIPARYASTRFLGKPLHLLNGEPMIVHTARRAAESSATQVVVATDDERIAGVCAKAGVDVEMTREDHPSGTDRIAEVAQRLQWSADTIIVGLQGDEPATPASHLDTLAANLTAHPDADMATLCTRIESAVDYHNPNRVKVVRDQREMAMYFSRAAIPAQRESLVQKKPATSNPATAQSLPDCWLHVGIYAYRCHYLMQYCELAVCVLELEERLEQLRVLYNGGKIHVGTIEGSASTGVDSPEDLSSIEAALAAL